MELYQKERFIIHCNHEKSLREYTIFKTIIVYQIASTARKSFLIPTDE